MKLKVKVMLNGKIIKTGDGMLADEIESEGYAKYLL